MHIGGVYRARAGRARSAYGSAYGSARPGGLCELLCAALGQGVNVACRAALGVSVCRWVHSGSEVECVLRLQRCGCGRPHNHPLRSR